MDVSPAEIMNCFKWKYGQTVLNPNTATRVLNADPNRVAVIVSNGSGATLVVWFDNTIAANNGIVLNNTVVNLQFLFKDLGPLVNQEIWAFSTPGGVISWAWTSFTPYVCEDAQVEG